MTACVRILSTASVDSSPSILLVNTDGSKILINCGEGCQRCFLEHSQKLSTVHTVCLTHLSHTSLGGLPGLVLTASDIQTLSSSSAVETKNNNNNNSKKNISKNNNNTSGNGKQHEGKVQRAPGLNLVGPTGTQAFINSLSHFMKREKFPLEVKEGNLQTVQPFERNKRGKSTSVSFSFSVKSLSFTTSSENESTNPASSKKRPRGSENNNQNQQTLSYLFTTQPMPGKFLPQKAAELGVPKGALYGQLKSGQAVTFVNASGYETTVQSHQVVEPGTPGVAILVLYYCNVSSGQTIFESETLQTLLDGQDVQLELVLHLTPDSSMIPAFVRYFESNNNGVDVVAKVEHVFVSTNAEQDRDGTPFRSAAMGAMTRSYICSSIYRVPRDNHLRCNATVDDKQQEQQGSSYTIGRTMMEYSVIPRSKRGFAVMSCPLPDVGEALKTAEQSGAVMAAKEILQTMDVSPKNGFKGELVFTGTGSAIPCKHRNVTGMSLVAANGNSMLLDVGEGTVGQLLRVHNRNDGWDEDSAATTLARIKAIWISHPHADHHLGVLRLLHDREAEDPVLLIAPIPLFRFLKEYAAIDPTIQGRYVAVDCRDLVVQENGVTQSGSSHHSQAREKLMQSFGWDNIRAVPVAHCAYSYAVILDGTPFGRLVYSGDCRPSNRLADTARPVDLLIHEATFEDGMEAEATLKRHSTVGEALSVARRMQAKGTVLTHFSQRYPKISPSREHNGSTTMETNMPVIFAFDAMCLTPQTILAASKLTPAMRMLYPDEEEKDDDCSSRNNEKEKASVALLSTPGLFAHNGVL